MNYFKKALLALLLFPTLLKAQSNFHKGYIVNLAGDTVRGSVDFKEWYSNPKQIKFKAAGADITARYSPATIKAFGINGYDQYRRFVVSVAQDRIDLSSLTHGIDTTTVTDTVFLKTIVTGKQLSLYSYIDKKEELFVQEGSGQPTSLIRHLYLVGEDRIATDARYIFQLQNLAKIYQPDNKKLLKDIERLRYDADDAGKILYRIDGSAAVLKAPETEKLANRFYVGAGADIASFSMYEENPTVKDYGKSSVMPMVNLGYDLFLKNNIGKLIIRAEMSFYGAKGDISRGYAESSETEYFKFNQYIVSLNPQLIFNVYNSKQFKFFIDAGFAANFSTYNNKQHRHLGGEFSSTYDIPFPYTDSPLFSLTGKTGIVINSRIEIFAGINSSNRVFTDKLQYVLSATHYRAGINLLLGKKTD